MTGHNLTFQHSFFCPGQGEARGHQHWGHDLSLSTWLEHWGLRPSLGLGGGDLYKNKTVLLLYYTYFHYVSVFVHLCGNIGHVNSFIHS